MTLIDMKTEIKKQKQTLLKDYAAVGDQFKDIYDSLLRRVTYHRIALSIIALIGALVVAVATLAFWKLTQTEFTVCIGSVSDLFAEVAKNASTGATKGVYGPVRPDPLP